MVIKYILILSISFLYSCFNKQKDISNMESQKVEKEDCDSNKLVEKKLEEKEKTFSLNDNNKTGCTIE